MKFLLVLIYTTTHGFAMNTEPFSDLQSCNHAGERISQWVLDNDRKLGNNIKFKCIKVTGK